MPTRKKPTTSTAVVPAAAPKDASDERLAVALRSMPAIARLRGTGGLIERDGGTTRVVGRPYVTGGGHAIDAHGIFYREDGDAARARGLGEADKVAWLDPETQLECIMMRAADGGFLGGYVAVPPSHPLYGFEVGAVPNDIDVHGGISYAAACQGGPHDVARLRVEAQRICHIPGRSPRIGAPVLATDYRVHDDAWWLGFACNKVYDLIPNDINDRKQFLGAEIAGTYRNDEYVRREIEHLARQLKAIADDGPMPERRGPPVPPLGLDPSRGA